MPNETAEKWSAEGTCVVRPEGDKDYYTKDWIADCRTRAYAEFIVRAANCHQEMFEALKAIVDAFGVGQSDEAFLRQMNDALIPDAQKTISKAGR